MVFAARWPCWYCRVFQRTWGETPRPFWPTATAAVREAHPGFMFMAEVYWDLEWTLQQQGFDYCYDKRLYDRLHSNDPRSVRGHLNAGLDYQDKLARFLRTMTNLGPPPFSPGCSTAQPRPLRSLRRAYASSIKASLRAGGSGCLLIFVAPRLSQPTRKSPNSMQGSYRR